MATTITCDKCDEKISGDGVYRTAVKDRNYDLCINCAAEVQSLIES